jgi:hypothetical protein
MLAPVSTNTPGQSTPFSAAAQVNVPVAVMHHSGHNPIPQCPYAAGGFEYPRGEATTEDAYTQPTVWSSFAHDVRCCTTGSNSNYGNYCTLRSLCVIYNMDDADRLGPWQLLCLTTFIPIFQFHSSWVV